MPFSSKGVGRDERLKLRAGCLERREAKVGFSGGGTSFAKEEPAAGLGLVILVLH